MIRLRKCSKKRLFLLALVVMAAALLLRGRPQPASLTYPTPGEAKQVPKTAALSKVEEYDQVLSGKDSQPLQQQTQAARFSFRSLFQPSKKIAQPAKPAPAPKQAPKPRKTAAQYFFSYGAHPTSTKQSSGAQPAQAFVRASIYQDQQVRDGEGVVVRLQEPCPLGQRTLPAGTLLYGAARFANNRILLQLTAAQGEGQRWAVSLTGYDSDMLQGLYYEGVQPWERPSDRVIDRRVGEYTGTGLLRDLGQGAMATWKNFRQQKTATLEDGRPLYVRP